MKDTTTSICWKTSKSRWRTRYRRRRSTISLLPGMPLTLKVSLVGRASRNDFQFYNLFARMGWAWRHLSAVGSEYSPGCRAYDHKIPRSGTSEFDRKSSRGNSHSHAALFWWVWRFDLMNFNSWWLIFQACFVAELKSFYALSLPWRTAWRCSSQSAQPIQM